MKYTTEFLTQSGWTGIQYNTMTGHTLEARYVLDRIAQTANDNPARLRFIRDDVQRKVCCRIPGEQWTPYSTIDCYAERSMKEWEVEEANERLRKLGITVTERN